MGKLLRLPVAKLHIPTGKLLLAHATRELLLVLPPTTDHPIAA